MMVARERKGSPPRFTRARCAVQPPTPSPSPQTPPPPPSPPPGPPSPPPPSPSPYRGLGREGRGEAEGRGKVARARRPETSVCAQGRACEYCDNTIKLRTLRSKSHDSNRRPPCGPSRWHLRRRPSRPPRRGARRGRRPAGPWRTATAASAAYGDGGAASGACRRGLAGEILVGGRRQRRHPAAGGRQRRERRRLAERREPRHALPVRRLSWRRPRHLVGAFLDHRVNVGSAPGVAVAALAIRRRRDRVD